MYSYSQANNILCTKMYKFIKKTLTNQIKSYKLLKNKLIASFDMND